jgi:hypothetical protein
MFPRVATLPESSSHSIARINRKHQALLRVSVQEFSAAALNSLHAAGIAVSGIHSSTGKGAAIFSKA